MQLLLMKMKEQKRRKKFKVFYTLYYKDYRKNMGGVDRFDQHLTCQVFDLMANKNNFYGNR